VFYFVFKLKVIIPIQYAEPGTCFHVVHAQHLALKGLKNTNKNVLLHMFSLQLNLHLTTRKLFMNLQLQLFNCWLSVSLFSHCFGNPAHPPNLSCLLSSAFLSVRDRRAVIPQVADQAVQSWYSHSLYRHSTALIV